MEKQKVKSFSTNIEKDYLENLKQINYLSILELQRLFATYVREKDSLILEKLMEQHFWLVVKCVDLYFPNRQKVQFMDLIQEGNILLMEAIKTYDFQKSSFQDYALSIITEGLQCFFAQEEKEFVVNELEVNIFHYLSLLKEYELQKKGVPLDEEICQKLNISKKTLELIKDYLSISYVPFSKVSDSYVEKNFDKVEKQQQVRDFLLVCKSVLSPGDYYLLYHWALGPEKKTLREIANRFGVTRQSIHDRKNKALKMLRPYLTENKYQNKLGKLKQQFGNDYDYLTTAPIFPEDIYVYLYMQNFFNPMEHEYYCLQFFSPYRYDFIDYLKYFQIDEKDFSSLLLNYESKMDFWLAKEGRYFQFVSELIKQNKVSIYKNYSSLISFASKEKKVPFKQLSRKF